MTECLQVATTAASEEEAAGIAEALVEGRLAACAQVVGPISSNYRWGGVLERGREWMCVAKTTHAAYPRVEAMIRELHSYEEPEIVATAVVAGSDGYLAWLT